MNILAHRTNPHTDVEAPGAVATAKVRLLATTDLHMHLTAHNFVTDQTTQNPGLAGIATLIAQARSEAAAQNSGCVLMDNGDLLQGTAMGDWLAHRPVTADHPAIACLHALGYDAVGVGNHDLDYGVPYLRAVAARLDLPMVATNLTATDLSPLTPAALIPCALPATLQTPARVLQLGVLSVLPEQTALWNHHLLDGVATVASATRCLRAAIPGLRARGADLVIVLAHMGLGQDNEENDTALPLAQIPGIDAMITGHTHRRFPGRDHTDTGGVNSLASTVDKVPVIMPGHAGSDLAVLDLTLHQDAGGNWCVVHHDSQLRSNAAGTHPAPAVLAATASTHEALRSHLSSVAGQAPTDLHNYFALAIPTAICAVTAQAKARLVRDALKNRVEGALPLIIATSAHTAGGRDGPQNFLHIPKGPVLRRHLTGLDPYSNQIWALRITGAELKTRLEHAASGFATLVPGRAEQRLRDPTVPIFNFDTIFGVTYVIDPTQPRGRRIVSLLHDGAEVAPDQSFVLVTNQFRAAGGGGYARMPADRVLLRSPLPLCDALTAVLADPNNPLWDQTPWRIKPAQNVTATLLTSPNATRYLADIAHLSPQVGPLTEDGFAQLHLTF